MNSSEVNQFLELANAVWDYYGKPRLSDMILSVYFNGLEPYSFDQVKHAISKHMSDTKNGQFLPKIADIVRHIEGGELSTDQILAAAREASTPLGVLCRIQIGSFDLNNSTDAFYLKSRAQECLEKMAEWKQRSNEGEYSDHEISIMVKFAVNPCGPFYHSLPEPKASILIGEKVDRVTKTARHQFLLEPPYKPDDEDKTLVASDQVREFLNEIVTASH